MCWGGNAGIAASLVSSCDKLTSSASPYGCWEAPAQFTQAHARSSSCKTQAHHPLSSSSRQPLTPWLHASFAWWGPANSTQVLPPHLGFLLAAGQREVGKHGHTAAHVAVVIHCGLQPHPQTGQSRRALTHSWCRAATCAVQRHTHAREQQQHTWSLPTVANRLLQSGSALW